MGLQCIIYHSNADDTYLYCTADSAQLAVENLQHSCSVLQAALNDLKHDLNAQKTEFMSFLMAKTFILPLYKDLTMKELQNINTSVSG